MVYDLIVHRIRMRGTMMGRKVLSVWEDRGVRVLLRCIIRVCSSILDDWLLLLMSGLFSLLIFCDVVRRRASSSIICRCGFLKKSCRWRRCRGLFHWKCLDRRWNEWIHVEAWWGKVRELTAEERIHRRNIRRHHSLSKCREGRTWRIKSWRRAHPELINSRCWRVHMWRDHGMESWRRRHWVWRLHH